MKIKIKKGKDKKLIEVYSCLYGDNLYYLCKKWRLRGYEIIKFITK